MTATLFSYEALDSSGARQKGTVQAETAEAAAGTLGAQKLIPLTIEPAGRGLNREMTLPTFRGRTTLKDLAVMSRQFASMTTAGLTLLRSLSILEEQTEKPKLRAAIGSVASEVQNGSTLSSAMAKFPEHFPLLMINMVRAGETGGFLDDALARIARMYEADAGLRAKLKSAMTYPVIVFIFSMLLGTGVLVFIVPVFEGMFRDLGGKLPLPTRVMVTLSHNMYFIVPIFVVGGLTGIRMYRKAIRTSAAFRLKTDRLKLKLPVFGSLFRKLAISRWARNLSTLLSVGVPIMRALEIVGGAAGNAVVAEAMTHVREAVRAGAPISKPLALQPLFPNMVVQMIEVGEQTGQTAQMLDKVADYYDEEVATATESLSAALEPLMVVLLGAVIGVMVVCLYLPMFSVYQHIQSN